MSALPNIVLVHGAWADGSSWSAVIEHLQADGYRVTAPQFPMTTLADDVARLRRVLTRQHGPTVVAGHSYGGQIIIALGTDTPNVVGLVYIAAFGLDEGESIGALLDQAPAGPALAHLDVDPRGFAWLPEDDFVNHFAADVDPVKAKVMFAVQQPLHWSALGEVMGVPAWKALPSWFLIADGDQAIPPDAQRQFAPRMGATTIEVPTNHVAMVSHPDEVVNLITTAAQAVSAATQIETPPAQLQPETSPGHQPIGELAAALRTLADALDWEQAISTVTYTATVEPQARGPAPGRRLGGVLTLHTKASGPGGDRPHSHTWPPSEPLVLRQIRRPGWLELKMRLDLLSVC